MDKLIKIVQIIKNNNKEDIKNKIQRILLLFLYLFINFNFILILFILILK